MGTIYKAGTIRQTIRQLQQDGYQVSEYALRRWVREGIIPSVCSGAKRFITYANVVEYLTTCNISIAKQSASI